MKVLANKITINGLSGLSLKWKVLSIALISTIGFAVYLAVNFSISVENEKRLESIETQLFPVLERADANIVRLDKMNEVFKASVSSGEEDMLLEGDKQHDAMHVAFKEIAALQPSYEEYLATIHSALHDYFNKARSLSNDMISGDADMGQIGVRIKEMQDSQQAVKVMFQSFRESMYSQFVTTLNETKEVADYALVIGAVTGVGVIALMILVALMVSRVISRNVNVVVHSLDEMASGAADLSVRLDKRSEDEIGDLVDSFNRFMEKIQSIMASVKSVTDRLGGVASSMHSISDGVAESVRQQMDETTQVATSITEMAATISEVAKHANTASQEAAQANSHAIEGKQTVQDTVSSMDLLSTEVERVSQVVQNLATESEKIGGVLDVIQGISEQTNLLALNAAIEAARAGEQGRGFAVVADEVRTLASRTQESTHEIQRMIDTLQRGASEAVDAMVQGKNRTHESVEQASRANASLASITASIDTINHMNTQIASATEEQSSVAQEIDAKTVSISRLSEDTQEGTSKAAQTSEQLNELSVELQALIGRYKV